MTILPYNHYAYQDDMDNAMRSNKYGLLVAPTGVGKGVSISRRSVDDFVLSPSKKILIQVVVSHRILLAMQLQQRIVNYCQNKINRVPFSRIAVHSGDPCEYETTSILEQIEIRKYPDHRCRSFGQIEESLETSINNGQDVLISVTYHSLPKLIKALNKKNLHVDLVYLDEIHNLSNNTWFLSCQQLKVISNSFYGFTATPGKALDRILSLMGQFKPIYEMSIHEAINLALITRPQWLIVDVDGDRSTNLAYGATTAILEHDKRIPMKFRVLIHCKDKQDVDRLGHKNPTGLENRLRSSYPDLMIAEISSTSKTKGGKTSGGLFINGLPIRKRTKWLESILKHEGELIVLHVDICNAGIDVPGFNLGLWTYVPGSEVYHVQGNGRSGRLDDIDRANLVAGIIKPGETDKMVKPFNTVGLLLFRDSVRHDEDEFASLIERSRELGFIPEDSILIEKSGISKKNPIPGAEKKPVNQTSLKNLVVAIFEDEVLQKKLNSITINIGTEDYEDFARTILDL